MERREEYEPLILDLQKSQAVRQPRRYVPLFVSSVAIFGILIIFALFYFKPLQGSPPPKPLPQNPDPIETETPQSAGVSVVNTPEPTPTKQPTPVPVAKGWLSLYSYPENAEVVIDGQVLGHTPLRKYQFAPGTYTVKFSYEGHISQQKITIVDGETTEFIYRFQGFGSLKIETTRSGSDITVNGKAAGRSPRLLEGLPPGEYTIIATKAGYVRAEKTITLKKGEHREFLMTIKPLDSVVIEEAPPTPRGRVLHPNERLQLENP